MSLRTWDGVETFEVGLVPAVASWPARRTRIRPPSRYFSTSWAGVSTPPIFWLLAREPALTLVASRP